ncbi:MAG: hypothetical protein ACK5RA_09645 [Cyanobacteriota bacterium]
MGQNLPITLGAAAVMALLAAPVLAQTASPNPLPTPVTGVVPRQPQSPKGAGAVVAPSVVPATPPAKSGAVPTEGSGVAAPPVRSAPAGLAPKVLVEPLILWQPEGSTSPRPAASPSSPVTSSGRLAPMRPGAGINPFMPGMAPQGAGGDQMDPRRRGGQISPAGGPPGARPQQRLRQGPNGMPMTEGMMPSPGAVPPGMLPPGAVPPGMMPPGAMPPGAGRPGPGAIPPDALPPGGFPPGVQPQDAPAARSPGAGAKSAQEWSPWPSLLATLGLAGAGVLLAILARRRSSSGSPTQVAIGEKGLKNVPLGRIQTGDKTD